MKILLSAILVAALLFSAVIRFDPRFEYDWDDSSYVIAAQAYLHGNGLTYENDPAAPLAIERAIGMPLLLIPIFALSGEENFLAAKLVVFALYLLLCLTLYIWLRNSATVGKSYALWVVALFGLNPEVVSRSHQVLAEIPYTLFSILGLAFIYAGDPQVTPRRRYLYLGLSALATVIAMYMRSIGMAFLIAIVIYLLSKRRFRDVAVWLACAGGLVLSMVLALGPTLGSPLAGAGYAVNAGLLNRLFGSLQNAWGYTWQLGHTLWPIPYDMLGHFGAQQSVWGTLLLGVLSVLFLGTIVLGVFVLWRTGGSLPVLYLGIYWCALALWPYVNSARFLLPVLPILLIAFVLGVQYLCQLFLGTFDSQATGLRSKVSRLFAVPPPGELASRYAIFFLALIALSSLLYVGWRAVAKRENIVAYSAMIGSPDGYEQGKQEYFRAALWAKDNLPANTIFVARSHYDFYLWSKRKTTAYGQVEKTDSGTVMQAISRADVVVEDSYWAETAVLLTPLIQQHPDQFQLVYVADGPSPTRLYRIVKSGMAQERTQPNYRFALYSH
jgi:hypothetical protein